jgi:ATP-dependent DNA helicase RecQ
MSTVIHKYNTSFDQSIRDLKPLQQTALESIVQGDVIAILPTGYGKSLIYELLPFHHFEQTNEPAVVLILEPLNVIIEQQTQKLKGFSYMLKNNSDSLNSFQNDMNICSSRSYCGKQRCV